MHLYARFSRAIGDEFSHSSTKKTPPLSISFEGFQSNGAVVLRDRRGTAQSRNPRSNRERPRRSAAIRSRSTSPPARRPSTPQRRWRTSTAGRSPPSTPSHREVANIQFRLYQVKGDDHEEQDDHPLLTLLDGVNEHMTGIELKYVTMAHLELTGNCYWLLDGVNSDTDKPRAIYPLNPGRVRVKLDKSTFPYKLEPLRIHDRQQGHSASSRTRSCISNIPTRTTRSSASASRRPFPSWIDSDNYAMEYNRKFFINGAQIGLYIQTDTNVEGNIERIKHRLRTTDRKASRTRTRSLSCPRA